jgi:choline dehydrogenase-like flavoprotein
VTCHPSRKTRFGLPMTLVQFDRTPAADAATAAWLEKMKQVIASMGYEIGQARADKPGGHHASGTCRMGNDPTESVTDRDLKVHGVDNLYICSNAVFPTSSAVNPTLTLVALAFRLSEHLISSAGR